MREIWALARRYGLFVIEDAAHAAGTHYDGRPIGMSTGDGNQSDVVVFSFYATKNMTTGEGGMIVTPSEPLAANMRMLSLHGMSRDAWNRYTERGSWYYEVTARGFKYNLSDIQSALGIHQLRKLESFIETRARYAEIYNRAFSQIEGVELPPDSPHGRNCWHLYMLRLNLDHLEITRQEFIEELNRRGIGTSVHFIPVPLHPYFAQLRLNAYSLKRALSLYERIVSLPLYPAMTEEQVRYVASSVESVLDAAREPAPVMLTEV
jgi:dTDP-4-amino-4,6-dideoxygalactose transaminase